MSYTWFRTFFEKNTRFFPSHVIFHGFAVRPWSTKPGWSALETIWPLDVSRTRSAENAGTFLSIEIDHELNIWKYHGVISTKTIKIGRSWDSSLIPEQPRQIWCVFNVTHLKLNLWQGTSILPRHRLIWEMINGCFEIIGITGDWWHLLGSADECFTCLPGHTFATLIMEGMNY